LYSKERGSATKNYYQYSTHLRSLEKKRASARSSEKKSEKKKKKKKKSVTFSTEKKLRAGQLAGSLRTTATPKVVFHSPCENNENSFNDVNTTTDSDFLHRDSSWSHIPTTPITPNVSFEQPDFSGYFPLTAKKSKTRMALL
jgi:hypothetical protein